MKNNLPIWILLGVLLFQTNLLAADDSKKFIPGVNEIVVKSRSLFDYPLLLEEWSGPENHEVKLVDNFGPNGEEALKLHTVKGKESALKVSYSHTGLTPGIYEFSVEYKADILKSDNSRYGSWILVSTDVPYREDSVLIYSVDRPYYPISLTRTDEWRKVKATIVFDNFFFQPFVVIYFGLDDSPASGTIYFINLKFEKLEDF